jgi:OPA family glycerol-3-phosphate transporter-like MFS transporter
VSQTTPEPPKHSQAFRIRRFLNWFPLGLTYALLYFGRYNLTVFRNAVGDDLMSKSDFGWVFGVGTTVYAFSFLVNGPLTDRIGGKKGMLIGAAGVVITNLTMGLFMRHTLLLEDPSSVPLLAILIPLYAINMYFQSYGAVSIVKVNSHWFHVRERGGFSGIFGTLIATGLFFAFDVNERIIQFMKGRGPGGTDAPWWVFFAPAGVIAVMWLLEVFLLKDKPGQAGHEDFDTGDASSGEKRDRIPTLEIFKHIFTSRVILTVAFIEFCTGVLRNGIMHWFPFYAKEVLELSDQHFLREGWGLLLMIAGIIGANAAGWTSDKLFGSRRAPAAGLLYLILAGGIVGMFFALDSPWALGAVAVVISTTVIGTHGLLSGTATMDFGGSKGAATAVGIIDGFVYLGTAVEAFALGYLTEWSWKAWPVFLLPFSILGFGLLCSIWKAVPKGKKGH